MKYVIFSIDKQNDPRAVNQFIGAFRNSEPKGHLIPVIGSYKGQTEISFICLTEDFDIAVRLGAVWAQESVLLVSECNKQYAMLHFLTDGSKIGIGSLRNVPAEVALAQDAWTYRPDLGLYWIAVQENPDHVPEQLELNLRDEPALHDAMQRRAAMNGAW